MGRAIRADEVELLGHEPLDAGLDPVADQSHLLERATRRVGHIPVLHRRRHERALGAAGERDRPVGVQLHLHGELLGAALGEVDPDLGHRLDDLGPDRLGRLLAR